MSSSEKYRSDASRKQKREYAKRPEVRARIYKKQQEWAAVKYGSHAEYIRRWTRARYGLTDADYECMLKKQNGVCAGCGKPPPKEGRQRVHHCHLTGIVRGLLCVRCNTLLGVLEQNPGLIQKLTKYQELFYASV